MIDYDKEIDRSNASMFRKYSTRNSPKSHYRCVICREDVKLEDSFSNQGERLLCKCCIDKHFSSIVEVLNWISP